MSNPRRVITRILLIVTAIVFSAAEKPEGRRAAAVFHTEVPVQPLNILLGRPTKSSITLSVIFQAKTRAEITYGPEIDGRPTTLPARDFPAGEPVEFTLNGLRAGTRHRYRIKPVGATAADIQTGTFTTARSAGETFVFTLQADSHLDGGTDPVLYRRSLSLVNSANADFHIDLGDTFMTDKRSDFRDALPQYLAQRHYFGLLGQSTPVFLVLGNHDGEDPSRGGDGADSMSVWANATRKHFFPNPEPNTFYTGNATPHPIAGPLQNYYAWTWGDALFVVLDPFWFTRNRSREGDNWPRTLGRAQYDWLERTLAASHARHKFVFIHHLAGGEGKEGRGGAEASRFFEWGGLNPDGTDTFSARRPEWPRPIHALLVAYGVSAVFHGHDHLFVKQERDGIVYQEVPQPGHPRAEARSAADYGYRSGVILPGAGILRVRVTPEVATIDFLRVDRDQPAYSYEIPATVKN